jgi:probable rRNA maturation factor
MPAIEVQTVVDDPNVPTERELVHWAESACREAPGVTGSAELTVRVVGAQESRELNFKFRNVDRATNVLAFPFEDPPGIETDILGDVVICAPVVAQEAADQHKPLHAHWAHMVVHGVLHLLGYEHENEGDAEAMESLEDDILHTLGFPGPYLADHG